MKDNFFLPLHRSKLDAMRAAAPRANLHLLHESDGFSTFLEEAAAARKHTEIGVLEDKADEPFIDPPVLKLFVPFDQMQAFCEAVSHALSVALVDVSLPTKRDNARYVAYAFLPKKPEVRKLHTDGPVVQMRAPQEKLHADNFWD